MRWLMRAVMIVLMLGIQACTPQVPVQPPTAETYEQMIQRTEGDSCDHITAHAEGEAPSCAEIVAPVLAARKRAAKIWPAAADIKMGQVIFFRPKRYYAPDKPYPLINLIPEEVGVYLVGGFSSPTGPYFISYGYPSAIEHEMDHIIGRILFGETQRTAEAIAADPGQDPALGPLLLLWQILCHGTPDDPLGVAHKRDSCDKSRPNYVEP